MGLLCTFLEVPQITWIDSTTRVIDYWFDNIFTDMGVRNQIKEQSEQIRGLSQKIGNIISLIETKKEDIKGALGEIDERRNKLIISLNL